MDNLKIWKSTVLKNYMDKKCPNKKEVSQILRFIKKQNIKVNIRISYQSVLAKYKEHIKKQEDYNKNYKAVLKVDDNLTWVRLRTKEVLEDEGELMGNCLNKQFDGVILSLHNQNNKPIIHLEIQGTKIIQIKQKFNKNVSQEKLKYIDYLIKNTKYKISKDDIEFISYDLGIVYIPPTIKPILSDYLTDYTTYAFIGHEFIKGDVKIKKEIPFDLSFSFMKIVSRLSSLESFFVFLQFRYRKTNHIFDSILETFIVRCINQKTIDDFFTMITLAKQNKPIQSVFPWFSKYDNKEFSLELLNINTIIQQLFDYETSSEFANNLIKYVGYNREIISPQNIWRITCGFCELYKSEYADKILKVAKINVNKLVIDIGESFWTNDKALLKTLLKNKLDPQLFWDNYETDAFINEEAVNYMKKKYPENIPK
jgi:hypothetical protein